MLPTTKWFLLTVAIFIVSSIGWKFGIGLWNSDWTYYQFNMIMGQAGIGAGIGVLIWEVQQEWYDEKD